MPACPPDGELLALLDETLPDERSDGLIAHLEQCRTCDARLHALAEADPALLETVRRAARLQKPDGESELECRLAVMDACRLTRRLPIMGVPQSLDVGRMIGPYRLVRLLGQGGMGAVYEAQHTRLEKTVALKLIESRLLSRPEAVLRFEREMRAIGKLSHPNLVTAFDAGVADGIHYLAMELVVGTDLNRLLAESGPLLIAQACDLMRQTALALGYIHQQGLIHRDIKPANLMRTQDGQIKLLDLGLAKLIENASDGQLTDLGQFLGTLDFIAPEQAADGQCADHRADLYSLGATFYALLTGAAPFATEGTQGVVQKLDAILRTTPTPVRERRTEVPEELSAFVERLLAKSPDHRPSTATEVATFLERYSSSAVTELASSPQQSQDRAFTPMPHLWPLRAAAFLAAVLVVLGALLRNQSPFTAKSGISGIAEDRTDQADAVTMSPSGQPSTSTDPSQPLRLNLEDARLWLFHAGRATTFGQIGFSGSPLDQLEPPPRLPRVGDRFRLEAKLTRPGYVAVLILNPDGTVAEYASSSGSTVDQFQFPAMADRDYHLHEGSGTLGIVLLCSDAPIAPVRLKPIQTAADGWSAVRIDGIWRYDGRRWLGRDPQRGEGPGEALPDALTRLSVPLSDGTELVRALALPVQPSDAPTSSPETR